MSKFFGFLLCVGIALASCNNNSNESSQGESATSTTTNAPADNNSSGSNQSYSGNADNSERTTANDDNEEEHKNQDGTRSATVDYYNPTTGTSSTYTLDVEVEDGQVKQINFPNGGYLDDDHITPADIDDDGNAHVEGEDGKTYDVHVDPDE
jgi:hypothetical protein